MALEVIHVLCLFATLFCGIVLAKLLGWLKFAFWIRRGLILSLFATSVFLSSQDNNTTDFLGQKPLVTQVYIYVFILGFLASWRLTPVGVTGA